MRDGALQRYRCHVGHAYAAQAMVEGQAEAQEVRLWQALRLMQERVSLLCEMRGQAENEHRADDVALYEAKVQRLRKDMSLIQAMIEEGEPTANSDDER